MSKIIFIAILTLVSVQVFAKTAAHDGLKIDSLKPKARIIESKKKKPELTDRIEAIANESLSDYEECGEPITDTSDEYYRLKRFRIRVGKAGDALKFAPIKGDPTAECAVLVTNKANQILGRLVGYCKKQELATKNETNQNMHNTFLKGSVLDNKNKPEFDHNFYYRLIGNRFIKAACIIQTHKNTVENAKEVELPQYIAIEDQKGDCEPQIYGPKPQDQVAQTSSKNNANPHRAITETKVEEDPISDNSTIPTVPAAQTASEDMPWAE